MPRVPFHYENGTLYKKCTRCEKDLPETAYGKHSRCSFGLNPWCRECVKEYRKENVDTIRETRKKKYQTVKNDPSFIAENRAKANRHYAENKEEKLLYAEEYRKNPSNKSKQSAYYRRYRSKNGRRLRAYCRKYQKDNRARITAQDLERRRKDPVFRMRRAVSSAVSTTLKKRGLSKGGKTFEALGYTPQDLVYHLEGLFDSKMSWENYGSYWVIDHIIPRCRFPFTNLSDLLFKECWALSNLRPIEKIENLRKGSKVLTE